MSRQLERARRVDDPLVLGQVGQHDRARAGGDDRVVELDGLSGDVDHFGEVKSRLAVDDVHLAALREPVEPAGELADDLLLPGAELVHVDLGIGERDAELRGILGLGKHLGGMKKSLGRDAADVEANPADHLMALDQRDLETKVRGAERGRVPAGTGTHDHDPLPRGLRSRRERGIRAVVDFRLSASPRLLGGRRRLGPPPPWVPRPFLPAEPSSEPPSSTTIGVPSLTLSLTVTRTSLTVPASGEGTSIVALSDSSVTSGCSTSTSSPGETWISMTGTSSKSPMSGTLTSHQSNALRRSVSSPARWATKRAAAAPSITRWS